MCFMLKIRLQRTGRKHEPTFRLVVTESENSTKSGKYLEILGNHDPRNKELTTIKADRVKHWIEMGAGASDTVHNMLVSKGIIAGKKVNALPKRTAPKKEAPVEAPKAEAPADVAPEATPEVAPEVAPEQTAA